MFPEAEAFALPTIGSDYSPLLLFFLVAPKKRTKLFRFEAFQPENEDCGRLVKQVWTSFPYATLSQTQKLKFTATKLATWSKKSFPNNQKSIIALKGELQQLMNSSNMNFEKKRGVGIE